ncbi:josephin-like protein [Phalaenopsis equestris]|uniref:josephin-like protein n=1 Tax=Phalaenopsis equestris TaxID=78828 RepID=UPI0009E59E77|nr:josephin-like protein [Phalaenopsis equestris]XP_020594343.1 josephin-like protein [Phalaenopsis equestris]
MKAFRMEDGSVYHERQRLQFCLLHALNNLLQKEDSFSRAELDSIAEKLDHDDPDKGRWTPLSVIFKTHHNKLTGNYDVNVLISALETRNKKVVWHDHRNSSASINLSSATLLGILLNIPVRRFAGLWRGRHWVSIRCIDGIWYNLDSDLSSPKPFRNLDELTGFLDQAMGQGGEVLVIFHDKL